MRLLRHRPRRCASGVATRAPYHATPAATSAGIRGTLVFLSPLLAFLGLFFAWAIIVPPRIFPAMVGGNKKRRRSGALSGILAESERTFAGQFPTPRIKEKIQERWGRWTRAASAASIITLPAFPGLPRFFACLAGDAVVVVAFFAADFPDPVFLDGL